MTEYQKVLLTRAGHAYNETDHQIEATLDTEEHNTNLGQRVAYGGEWWLVTRLIGNKYEVQDGD